MTLSHASIQDTLQQYARSRPEVSYHLLTKAIPARALLLRRSLHLH
jgi:hypothetical protein